MATFGQPGTSGVEGSVDYFLSSRRFESPAPDPGVAQDWYEEVCGYNK